MKILFPMQKERIKYQSVIVDRMNKRVTALAYISIKTDERPELASLKHFSNFDLTVLKEFAHLEIIEELFNSVIQHVKNYDYVTTIKGGNIWGAEWNLWLKKGTEHYDTIQINRLYFDEVDWDEMNQWREEGEKKAKKKDVSLQLIEECPEEIIEDFSKLYTDVGNLIPYEEEDNI